MKTFEVTMTIKWYKNDNGGDKRPLTICCDDRKALIHRLNEVKENFMKKGEDKNHTPSYRKYKEGELPYSVKFEISERK